MNRLRAVILGAGLIGCVGAGASSAQAQIFAPSYGFAGGTGPYNLYIQDTPPFYAMYPPVYYSQPMSRAYGWSPFAYPPGVATPQNQISAPMGVQTSAVYDSNATPAPAEAFAQAPLTIENPYVRQRPK
ncbi:MAG TPA: hypothetical protein VHY91_17835 [Pirellulales bacterium]|jgi:hypothetical protein|nr:hypothetical protein [Pirellulales bacterium]